MAILEARGATKIFSASAAREIRAVDGVSLTIEAGTCWALTGPSGSGKSTLLALLGAIDRPTSGEIHFDGKSLAELSDIGLAGIRRRLGFVFQNFALLPGLAVWENVSYPLVPRGTPRGQRLSAAREALERFALADRLFDPAGTLSGGEQQRVCVARALIAGPEVVFADEPTNQLDDSSANDVIDAFRDLVRRGTTLILATHDTRLMTLATHVGQMQAGKFWLR
ncbi:MAG TPA: ABC transporter ATP-binding protein [Pirellulales bacterium]|jgi:putative ABC transport system ATP-binding protein|nr:ABC transporter ATP-binding protein [Pirellulales bacterium]